MFRRVVAFLLVPCVLLTQSAAVLGHAHVGEQLPGHDARPHFHTHDSGHDHGEAPAGHDDDAVYLPGADAVVARTAATLDLDAVTAWLPAPAWAVADSYPVTVGHASSWRPPPAPPCRLYVRHLALLL